MPLAPPVIKIVLLLSFILKYPGKFSHGIVFHAVPRRSLCSAQASAAKSDPPSQGANPIAKALRLHYHQLGLTRPVGQNRDSLQCREKVDSKASRVVSVSICPKLILYPGKQLSEECRRFFRERPAFLVQFGAKRPKGTPSACKHIPVPKRILDTRLKAFFRGTLTVPLFPQRPKFRQVLLHNGLADFIFRLEVVVDVADRDLGRLSDIGYARRPEPMSVRQLHSRANQP